MPLGDLPECRHVFPAGEETDAQVRLLASRPEPVERAIGPPRLLMRLVEGKPKPEHARPFAPMGDDLLAIRALEIEMPEDAEFVRVQAHRLDGELVDGLAERAGRMDHRSNRLRPRPSRPAHHRSNRSGSGDGAGSSCRSPRCGSGNRLSAWLPPGDRRVLGRLRIHRPTHAIGLCLEEMAVRAGHEDRREIGTAETARWWAVRRHRVRFQHAPGG